MSIVTPTLKLFTPTYRRDIEQCRAMCDSVDRFAPDLDHMLLVPSRDLDLFRPFVSSKREVVVVEEILRAKRLRGERERWKCGSVRTSGWVMQQITKIEAARRTGGVAIFIDSDVVLIRSLTRDHVIQDGRVRLYRDATGEAFRLEPHYASWNLGAARMLGAPERPDTGYDYITQLVAWHTDTVRGMCGLIQETAGGNWFEAAARQKGKFGLSEYVLYGMYADTYAADLHFATDKSLCLLSWFHDLETDEGRDAFVRAVEPHHVAVLIQSNLRLPEAVWRPLSERVA